MRFPFLCSIVSGALVLSGSFSPMAAAAESVGIARVVPYAETTDVRDAVREECRVGETVAEQLVKRAKDVAYSDQPDTGRYLDMAITNVHAGGGGAFSGPKWIEVKGTLKDGGVAVASFRAKRFSTGGVWAPFKGTCTIVARCSRALAADIAAWLENPVDGAEIGDAQ